MKPNNNFTQVIIIQPPLVQLNTPYPSGAYLQSFFKKLALNNPEYKIDSVNWIDGSNELYHKIFSRESIAKIFSLTETKAKKLINDSFQENISFNLKRFLSQQDSWIRWLPVAKDILHGKNLELRQEFIMSPSVPRGQRMENYLVQLNRNPSVDDARILATFMFLDFSDYITTVFDSSFGFVRYNESLSESINDIQFVENSLKAPILTQFYKPLLEEKLSSFATVDKILICISCPFPGTLAGALISGKIAKDLFGTRAFVVMGGGYVNTELRDTKNLFLEKYIDALSYDRGYGSYIDLFNHQKNDFWDKSSLFESSSEIYKMKLFSDGKILFPVDAEKKDESNIAQLEDEYTCSLVPDYTGIEPSKYPILASNSNPMERMWAEGTWLKAYLAHGCYWHRCGFCDTSLDYVCSYKRVNVEKLHKGLYEQGKKLGVAGVHLVDEAAPPVALKDFALLNLKESKPLSFWGNIRFEKSFNRDLADFLAHGGLTGVSGGIEIACGIGLDSICKGIDIDTIVSACAAFKEAGILTHAYMIYGYWLETEQILVDSMETLRQLFQEGLLDSAFWHKFVLTKHSTVFKEYLSGKHPELNPLALDGSIIPQNKPFNLQENFAGNDIAFLGQEKSIRYGKGLNIALENWMNGRALSKPVRNWFDFPLPKPTIPGDYIKKSIAKYEKCRNKDFSDYKDFIFRKGKGYYWLGGRILVQGKSQFSWTYMGELLEYNLPKKNQNAKIIELMDAFYALRPNASTEERTKALDCLIAGIDETIYKAVRGQGLCKV